MTLNDMKAFFTILIMLLAGQCGFAQLAGHTGLALELATNLAGRTNGIEAQYGIYTGTMELANWQYAVYSGKDLARLTNAVWSQQFWLKGVQGLSATSIGSSNGMGGQGLITMVSPRHYLFATHMHPEGFMVAFLATNNVIHFRRSLQRVDVRAMPEQGVGPDISVGIFDADMPSSVGFLPVLPVDYTNALPADGVTLVQGIGMNQELRCFGEPMAFGVGGGGSLVGWDSRRSVAEGVTTNWNMMIRGGDSSNPALLLFGNQLVLVSHNYFVGGGPNYAQAIPQINAAMHYLSTNNGVGSDYQLTVFPLGK
jgi:hypothetical protein